MHTEKCRKIKGDEKHIKITTDMFSRTNHGIIVAAMLHFFHVKEAASKLTLHLSLRKYKSTE